MYIHTPYVYIYIYIYIYYIHISQSSILDIYVTFNQKITYSSIIPGHHGTQSHHMRLGRVCVAQRFCAPWAGMMATEGLENGENSSVVLPAPMIINKILVRRRGQKNAG